MPTYLCHGFRWIRHDVRIFVILHDLEDAAADWVVGPTTSSLILSQFAEVFDFLPKVPDDESETESILDVKANGKKDEKKPHLDDDMSKPPPRVQPADDSVLMHQWSPVKLLEEYDPEATEGGHTRPYAYVADHAVRIDLSANIAEEMVRYEILVKQRGGSGWLEELRKKVHFRGPPPEDEKIGWFVVVCGDEERAVTGLVGESEENDGDTTETETEPPQTATTTLSQSTSEWPLPNGPLPNSSQEFRHSPSASTDYASTDYSSIRPPPIPSDDGKAKKPSLRRKLSRASGLRRIFGKKDAVD